MGAPRGGKHSRHVWLVQTGTRDKKPAELIRAMNLKPGMTVADLGTGVGYMLPYLSRAVGPEGRVIAEDIQDDFLAQAKERAGKESLANVAFVKGTERDPVFRPAHADVVFVLDAYHHFDYPAHMLSNIAKALSPGAG